jgi:hypothetical protein
MNPRANARPYPNVSRALRQLDRHAKPVAAPPIALSLALARQAKTAMAVAEETIRSLSDAVLTIRPPASTTTAP